jgi:hypothetical protein
MNFRLHNYSLYKQIQCGRTMQEASPIRALRSMDDKRLLIASWAWFQSCLNDATNSESFFRWKLSNCR